MTDQQSPQPPQRGTDGKQGSSRQGDLRVTIGGNVGPGAAIGQDAFVQADNIAGRDLTDNRRQAAPRTREDFTNMLGELRGLLERAKQAGELEGEAASKAIEDIQIAADMAAQPQPPKRSLLRRLQNVAALLEAASQAIEKAGGMAKVIGEAIPMVALLLDLVNLLF